MRPWEIAAGTRAFEQQEFVYPRTISIIRRPVVAASAAAAGPLNYQEAQTSSGVINWTLSPIYSGIACSIQQDSRGQTSGVNLPSSTLVALWRIFIPRSGLAEGSVLLHDYILDDLGSKYEVIAPYWDSLGYRLQAISRET